MLKRGRGGGGKRRLLPAPPRLSASAPDAARIPPGSGARSRPGPAPGVGGAPEEKEESFSLSSSADVDFGAIIRLTPDLIEEIRRVELEGGSAKIKFATNSNFPTGNVIEVSGKEFGFTWSRDDLCDIYEERQSGEDGDGLLVERGSAWRKLNVHRILDESTKKHVKERSEQAERLSKSRKAIRLDPANSAMKDQVKKMAAAGVEGNMRRVGWKQKKEPVFRKQKAEPNQGPQKSVQKSGTSSNKPAKGMLLESPISPPDEHPPARASLLPFAAAISSRGVANLDIAPSDINKKHADLGNCEKEIPIRELHGAKRLGTEQKKNICDQPMDSQNTRAEKASQYIKAMNLKALEKAIGETRPNATKSDQSIIKTTESAGKYLKSGKEVESSKQQGSGCGRSLESTIDITSLGVSTFIEKDVKFPQQARPSLRTGVDLVGKIDIMADNCDPSDNGNDKTNSNDSEGTTSSSESGSDCDSGSESSDSGSDSGNQGRNRSKSKSKSPVGSASASTSDSDGSSSSKEGSDVDVDIMTIEDEKEVDESKTMETNFSLSGDHGGYRNENGLKSKVRRSVGNKSPASCKKGSVYRMELSDLEARKLCKAPSEAEVAGVKRPFQGEKFFKSSKRGFVDSSNLDTFNERSGLHPLLDSQKHSSCPSNLRGEVTGNQDGLIDAAKLLQRRIPSQGQLIAEDDHADLQVNYSPHNSTEIAYRGDLRTKSGTGVENRATPFRKTPASSIPDVKKFQVGERNSKELREHKRNILGDSTNWSNNSASMGNYTNSRKRKECPSQEDNAFYSKYEKEDPHVKDSINDLSQYQDYVQEFHEKYDRYVSLNKDLENIRNNFLRVGEQLERTKGESEEYYMALNQLKDLYHQHGERNKKMKKTFIMLHDELKSLKQRIREFVEMHKK